ncbi:SDR family NAD(P)-dependent oxidoreductase [Thermophilibacter provencensis]|uniref:3-oxoacyl-ACP reductase family protein n=1 Tax=Thermophilibacter provencensis TaxID=1852386 RepID=A0ABT7V5R4_9ACTN|nr:3-oxoacyl-ACP reductase family protein [Thermophilibacter provencensis]MDM8271299.1 3-oxoacyl-ACP reductase family protein [Thermophilibacter provencensis]
MLLKGKTAVVTGGSRGIGLAIVKRFLEEGANVALCGSREETAQRALDGILAENPDAPVMAIWPSVADEAELEAAFRQVAERFGGLDIVCNNAGISQSTSLDDYTPEEFDKIIEINVKGVLNGCQAASRVLGEGGVIINTSSMVSKMGQPSGVAYPMSKFAVNGITISLARELGPRGIRVNAVAPGVTATDMVACLPEELIAPIEAGIPLKRVGQPEDVANAFVYLASDLASYVTGEVLAVDGGMTV